MVVSGERPPFRFVDDVVEAAVDLTRAAVIDAHLDVHGRRIRRGPAAGLIGGTAVAMPIVAGMRTGPVILVLTAAAFILAIGGRWLFAQRVGVLFDRVSGGSESIRVALTIRPDGLQVADGATVAVLGWRHLQYRRTERHLQIVAPGGGGIVVPRAQLPTTFDTALEHHLRAAGALLDPADQPTPVAIRILVGILALALILLVLCAVILVAHGGPRQRLKPCPDGQLAVVTQGDDGSLTTYCV